LELERDVLLLQNENLCQVRKKRDSLKGRSRKATEESLDTSCSDSFVSSPKEGRSVVGCDPHDTSQSSQLTNLSKDDSLLLPMDSVYPSTVLQQKRQSLEDSFKEREREFQTQRASMEQQVHCLRMNVRLKEVLIRKLVHNEKKLSEKLKVQEEYANQLAEKIRQQEQELKSMEERRQQNGVQKEDEDVEKCYAMKVASIRTEVENLEKHQRKLRKAKERKMISDQERRMLEKEVKEMRERQEQLMEQIKAEEERYQKLQKEYEQRLENLQKCKETSDKDLNRWKEECYRQKSIIIRQQQVSWIICRFYVSPYFSAFRRYYVHAGLYPIHTRTLFDFASYKWKSIERYYVLFDREDSMKMLFDTKHSDKQLSLNAKLLQNCCHLFHVKMRMMMKMSVDKLRSYKKVSMTWMRRLNTEMDKFPTKKNFLPVILVRS
jgi:hypothetical protein